MTIHILCRSRQERIHANNVIIDTLYFGIDQIQFKLNLNGAVSDFSPSNQMINFCKLLDESNNLQSQIKKATTAEQIIAIAASNGYEISHKELRTWSKELTAPYFPWSEKGNEWRRNFFS